MHYLVNILLLKKFKKNFIFFNSLNYSYLHSKKNIVLFNYQNGINFYFYNGVKCKSIGKLLNKKIVLYRKKDFTFVKFLLFSPIIIYLF